MNGKEKVTVYLGGERDVGRVLPESYEAFFEPWELAAVLISLAVLSISVMLV